LPYVGLDLTQWIWGGFSVRGVTLTRFYSFHFLFPFVLLVLVFFHLIFLHLKGSSMTLVLDNSFDKIYFHPFFSLKDLIGFFFIFSFFFIFLLSFPQILGDPENFSPANYIITPVHIQPE
jgi:ubiquinol-cytochrome c reductase cytochrome b subunit